jgi:hypothetical protein
VDVSLNKVTAPASVSSAALTAVVGVGVEHNQPVNLLTAQVGQTDTTVDAHGSHASVTLADAHLHVPGLPFTALLGIHAVSAAADCPVDGAPTATAEALGKVTVLGVHLHLSADGVTRVPVPALGEVILKLSQHSTTSDTAAATAVGLDVDVNPLALNVAAAWEARARGRLLHEGGRRGSSGGSDGGPLGGSSGGTTPSDGPSQGLTGGTGVAGGKGRRAARTAAGPRVCAGEPGGRGVQPGRGAERVDEPRGDRQQQRHPGDRGRGPRRARRGWRLGRPDAPPAAELSAASKLG